MKADIYVRVSTPKQEESKEEHVRILRKYCEDHNYEINQIYTEVVSGKSGKRPVFEELLDDVRNKQIDLVVVLKLDRFSRSMLDLLETIEIFKQHGVGFVCLQDNIDTTTPHGTLLMHMLGALAEFERSLIYERTKIGIERAKREGKICHRPKKPINIERVVDRFNKGISLTEIAAYEKVSYGTLVNRLNEAGIKFDTKRNRK